MYDFLADVSNAWIGNNCEWAETDPSFDPSAVHSEVRNASERSTSVQPPTLEYVLMAEEFNVLHLSKKAKQKALLGAIINCKTKRQTKRSTVKVDRP